MKHVLVAFVLAAGLASAQESCPGCKPASGSPASTALADARKAVAEAPKLEEKLPAEQLAQLTKARDVLKETAMGKALAPTFEACSLLMLAAAKQEGSPKEATALLKEMGATYCGVAKMFGGFAGCKDCTDGDECCDGFCKDMSAADVAKKANESLANAKKLMDAAMAECKNMTPEQQEKMGALAKTAMEICPRFAAMQKASAALNGAFETLAKMGIPSTDAKNATRDGLVRSAMEMQQGLCGGECEEKCEGCEGQEEEGAEQPEPPAAPARSS